MRRRGNRFCKPEPQPVASGNCADAVSATVQRMIATQTKRMKSFIFHSLCTKPDNLACLGGRFSSTKNVGGNANVSRPESLAPFEWAMRGDFACRPERTPLVGFPGSSHRSLLNLTLRQQSGRSEWLFSAHHKDRSQTVPT